MLNSIYRFFYPAKNSSDIRRKYNIPDKINFKIRFQDNYIILTSSDYPGLITQAKTLKELLYMFNDAILTYYDVPKREGDIVLGKINTNIEGIGTIMYEDKKIKQLA